MSRSTERREGTRRRPAAGARVAVADGQARLRDRAAAARRVAGDDPRGRPAVVTGRAVARAARRRRRATTRATRSIVAALGLAAVGDPAVVAAGRLRPAAAGGSATGSRSRWRRTSRQLHATVATIAHQERREHLDRLEVLRRHTFGLDHLFMSLFSTLGWVAAAGHRRGAAGHPGAPGARAAGAVRGARPWSSRPGGRASSRPCCERVAPAPAAGAAPVRARHDRPAGQGAAGHRQRRSTSPSAAGPSGGRCTGRCARAKWGTALWSSLAWAVFGLGYVGAVVFTATVVDASPGRSCSCWWSAASSRSSSARRSASSASCAASGWTSRAG